MTIRILVVRAWTEPLAELRAALRSAGCDARITRVDIEPALVAALARGRYDVVIVDPAVKELPRATIEARLRDHRHIAAIVPLTTAAETVEAVLAAMAAPRDHAN